MSRQTIKSLGWMTVGGLTTYGLMTYCPPLDCHSKKLFERITKNSMLVQDTQKIEETKVNTFQDKSRFERAIKSCEDGLKRWRAEQTIPGYVIGVSIGGEEVWVRGDGLADIENGVPCDRHTVMRIASISKSMASALLAKMVQDKQIDLDTSIHKYLSEDIFPVKEWEGQKVDITVRQLASHLGGIRHYKKENSSLEFETKESNLYRYFPTLKESLTLFKDDPLVAKPGTKFVYTTHGFTLISAVMETQMPEKDFSKGFMHFLKSELGLTKTRIDLNSQIIPHRASYYSRNSKGGLKNVPAVDLSYKWAGGGLLSTVPDLLRFGNMMLYSYLGEDPQGRPGFLHKSTVEEMWRASPGTILDWQGYGIGWVVEKAAHKPLKAFAAGPPSSMIVSHSGSAIGATSMLLIDPDSQIVVALFTNLQSAGQLYNMTLNVAQQFKKELNLATKE